MDKPFKIIKANIRYYRTQSNMTQEDLAEKAQVSWSYLSAIESGSKYPSLKFIMKMARALDVELFQMFREREDGKIRYKDISSINTSLEKIAEKVETLESRLNNIDSEHPSDS